MNSKTWQARLAIDGGITTGVCYGIFPRKGSMAQQISKARRTGGLKFLHVTPTGAHKEDYPELSNALQIYDLWYDWNEQLAAKGLPPCKIIIEDFRIRTQVMTRSVLSSVRVANLFSGMCAVTGDDGDEYDHLPKFIDPSQSKNFATNTRMKTWGFWERGMDHAMDAARLIAVDLANERNTVGRA